VVSDELFVHRCALLVSLPERFRGGGGLRLLLVPRLLVLKSCNVSVGTGVVGAAGVAAGQVRSGGHPLGLLVIGVAERLGTSSPNRRFTHRAAETPRSA